MKRLLILFLALLCIILPSCSSSKQEGVKFLGTLPQSSIGIPTESTDLLIELSTSPIEQSSAPTYDESTQSSRIPDEDVETLRIAFHDAAEYAKYLNNEEMNRTVLLMFPGLDNFTEDKQIELVNQWIDVFNSMNKEIENAQKEFETIISDGLYQNELERVEELNDIVKENTYILITEQ